MSITKRQLPEVWEEGCWGDDEDEIEPVYDCVNGRLFRAIHL